jgi:hypothetical protein
LWRDRVEVGLYPDRLVLVRKKGEQTIALGARESGAAGWRAALDALSTVAAEVLCKMHVTVVLSSSFVRYTLLPRSEALTRADERLAFARHCLARVHGSAAEGWAVRLSGEVACGVERPLVEELKTLIAAHASRFRSLQPRLMAGFNRCRSKLGERPGWFVDVEPGLASLALVQRGQWHSLRTVKIGPSWQDELPGLLSREACFVDSPADCIQVVHAGP